VGEEQYRANACAFDAPTAKPTMPATPVKLYFNDEYTHRRLAESVAAQWHDKLGLTVELQPLNWDQYLQRATTGAGFDGAFRVSWAPKVATGVNYLDPLFSSGAIGNTNLERYSDVRFDDTLNRDIFSATDVGDQAVRVKKLEDKLCADLPLLPIVFGRTNMLVRDGRLKSSRVDGRIFDPAGELLLQELSITS
jgi:ABC-type oligopeptide transport system substrate-binding subunit